MTVQKLRSLFVLILLFLLGMVYSAQVFVSYSRQITETVMANDVNNDSSENGEESLKETSQHLFLQEKSLFYLKPVNMVVVNIPTYIEGVLPEAYLQLNTPPPDFA